MIPSLLAACALLACGGSPAQVEAPKAAPELPEAPNPCVANPCGATSIDPAANPCVGAAAPAETAPPANPCAGEAAPAAASDTPAAEDAPQDGNE